MHNWLEMMLGSAMLPPLLLFAALVAATFVLEDVATVAAGLLAGRMSIDPVVAITAVVAGTIAGDLALYAVGRWLGTTRLAAQLRARTDGSAEARLRRHGLLAVAVARFVPGTRLPVFFGSGVVRTPFALIAAVMAGTTLLWTPVLFLASSHAGASVLAVVTPTTLSLAAALLAAVFLAPGAIRRLRPA